MNSERLLTRQRLILHGLTCLLALATLAAEDKPAAGKTDYREYLKLELARLEKMAAAEGLTAESKQYVEERIADIKKRMVAASDAAPGQMVEFMNTWAFGSRFVYVIDKSLSMAGKQLKAAKAELVLSLSRYSPETAFCVIFYDTAPYEMPGGALVRATKENVARCEEWLAQVPAKGKTNPSSALIKAMELGPDAIFLLSDGLFDASIPPLVRALNVRDRPVVVNTIAFMSDKGAVRLKQIAEENHGQYAFVGLSPDDKSIRVLSWLPFFSSGKKKE